MTVGPRDPNSNGHTRDALPMLHSVNQRLMRRVVETAPQGILAIDADGTIQLTNRALDAMFGWQPGELLGQPIERLLPADTRHRHAAHLAEYFSAPSLRPRALGLDVMGTRKDGSTFPVEISLNGIQVADSRQAFAFVTDLTERHRVAATLEESRRAIEASHQALADRNTELERRSAQLSRLAVELTLAEQHAREELARTLHDHLQQFLFSTKVQLARLEQRVGAMDEGALFARVRESLNEAIDAARSLSVELFPPVLQTQGLPAALAWLADRMKRKYDFQVRASLDPRAEVATRHVRTLLFESVRELLFNVVKHARVSSATLTLELSSAGLVTISIADTGVGFDPVTAEAEASGQTGLGLFSIRERVSLLGGSLEVESAPGSGTRVRLIVPAGDGHVSDTSAVAVPAAHTTQRAALHPIRILVVDDHVAVREGLRELLRERPGLEVVGEAASGAEALDQARTLRPDVIVIDASMPHMEGIDATRRIHQELPDIRIFGLSTYESPDDLEAIEHLGAVGHFTRETDAQRLAERILDIGRGPAPTATG